MKKFIYLVSVITFLSFPVYSVAQDKPVSNDKPVSINTVKIENFMYSPDFIEIAPGTTVQWINADSVAHDVTSGESITGRKARGLRKTQFPDGMFSSGLFGKNKMFSETFNEKGVYPYYCNIHPFMMAKVIVR